MAEQVSAANAVLTGELLSVPAFIEHRRSLLNVQATDPGPPFFWLLSFGGAKKSDSVAREQSEKRTKLFFFPARSLSIVQGSRISRLIATLAPIDGTNLQDQHAHVRLGVLLNLSPPNVIAVRTATERGYGHDYRKYSQ